MIKGVLSEVHQEVLGETPAKQKKEPGNVTKRVSH